MSRAPARLAAAGVLAALSIWILWLAALRSGPGDGVGEDQGAAPGVSVGSGEDLERAEDVDLAAVDRAGALRDASGFEGDGFVRLRGPGRLTGTVRIRGASGGLDGATVTLTTFPAVGEAVARHAAQFLGAEGEFVRRVAAVASVKADAAGEFAFEGVAEGRWYLSATSDHHVQESPVSARVLASGVGGPVEVWMRPGGRVVGRVLDGRGRPVRDADVALATDSLTVLEAAADGELAYLRTTTDREGAFAFPGVAPAEGYEVAAIGAGIAIVHAGDIHVREGEDTFVELTGSAGATVRGRVVSAGEETLPLEGAQVAALPRGLRHLKLAKELLVNTHAVTDAEGRYELRHVPAGTSDLLGMAEAHVPGRGPALRLSGALEASFQAPDFALVRGPQVAGIVVDEQGLPLEGVRILWSVIDIATVQGEPSLAPIFAAGMKEFRFPVTESDGVFQAGPFAGRRPFQIRAVKSGYGVGEVEWSGGDGDSAEPIRIVLRRGGVVRGVVLDATDSSPVPLFTAAISGRIETDEQSPSRFNPFAQGVEFEGPDGRFEIEDVVKGEQLLRVTAPGYVEQRVTVSVDRSPVGEDDPLVVRLVPGTSVRGMVVDGEGEPIAGALVTTEAQVAASFERLEAGRQSIETALAVKGRPPQKRTPPVGLLRHLVALGFVSDGVVQSGEDGTFALTGLEPGQTELLAFHRDYRAGGVLVSLSEGENEEPVTITLTTGGGLRGKVLDTYGQPVAAAMVLAVSPGLSGGPTANGEFHQARSRSDGSYEMRNLEGGSYLVVATRGDENLSLMGFFGTLNFDLVTVPPSRVVTKNLVDTSANACRVTGVVTRAGVPVTGGVLLAVNLESEGLLGLDLKAAAIEGDGTFAFEGLVEGEYEVTFEGEGPRAQFLFDVPDAPSLVHDVALPEGVVRGRIVDGETGAPVSGVRLRLQGSGGDAPGGGFSGGLSGALSRGIARELFGARGARGLARTGSVGRFRFTGLEEGRYWLWMESSRASADYAPFADVSVEVVASTGGEVLDLGDIVLTPAMGLRGRVLDEEGSAVAGARIIATLNGERPGAGGFTTSDLGDEEGRFELHGVGPGEWQLRVLAEGFAVNDRVHVAIEEGVEPAESDVVLERGIDVVAVVVDGQGQPRAGVACALAEVGGRQERSGLAGFPGGTSMLAGFFTGSSTTDERGERALGVYVPGDYVLRASQGFASAERRVTLRPGDPGRLELVLE